MERVQEHLARLAMSYIRDSSWHLDKKVPIALVVTLLLQGAFAIMWASRMSVEVAHITEEINRIRIMQEKIVEYQRRIDVTNHRLEFLEGQLKVLMTIQRLNKMRNQSPSE